MCAKNKHKNKETIPMIKQIKKDFVKFFNENKDLELFNIIQNLNNLKQLREFYAFVNDLYQPNFTSWEFYKFLEQAKRDITQKIDQIIKKRKN